jgi:hypothetical protein
MKEEAMAENLLKARPKWDMRHLRPHLQGVVDLEFWTIPYYLTTMYSIKDPTSEAYKLIQAVVYQEMLHAQLASNVANSFGYSPTFDAPVYQGTNVPHINFSLDVPNPTEIYTPFSAELGPLDQTRVNTMCLIEYPEWDTHRQPDLNEDHSEYGSIAEFYDAVRWGVAELRHHLRGGVNQVNEFQNFYANSPPQIITLDGDRGYQQAMTLFDIIVDQGEGQTEDNTEIPTVYQNTADGYQDSWDHFQKFNYIREMRQLPATYSGVANPEPGSPGHKAQLTLLKDFAAFRQVLESLFSGGDPEAFGPLMAKLGGDVLTCWQRGAIPRFS